MSLKNVYHKYLKLMHSHPHLMQAVQTGMLMAAGDMLAQSQLEKKGKDIEFKRTAVYACVGFFFMAPLISRWYIILERLYGSKITIQTTIKKVATDQLIFAPLCLPVFVTLVSFGEGKTFEDVKNKLNKEYWNMLKANYEVWPLFQLINFYFIPLNYRLITLQALAILWNAYLSYKIN